MEYQEVGQAEVQIVLTDIQVYAQVQANIKQTYPLITYGPDLTLGITPYYFNQLFDGSGSAATDNNDSTYFRTNGNGDFRIDLGSAKSTNFVQFIIGQEWPTEYTYEIWGSNTSDFSTYTLLTSITASSPGGENTPHTLTSSWADSTPYRYIEFHVTATSFRKTYTFSIFNLSTATSPTYAQANSQILAINYAVGNSVTQILATYNIYSQADSWTVYRQETGEYIWPQFGQAYAHILTIDVQAYSQALAMIALQRYTTTFSDTFSRVTTPNPFNLGTSDSGHTWNWSNWASSTPPTAIYTDGSNLIFTSGGNSVYTIYPSGPSPSSGSNYVDLLYDIWITNSYDSNHYFYWFEKDWWFYIYDNSSSTFGIWSYGGSGGYAVIRNSFYRVRAIYDPTGPGGIYLKAHMWKVGDAEPGTWTTLQVQKVNNYNSPGSTYYNQSPILYWGKPSSEAGKLDNIAYNSVYNTVYNQGQAQAQTNILTTYQQYGQAHVTLNQSQYTGQALASILSVYQNYSQAQANIRKSAGYGQARALLNRHWAFAIATFYSFNPTPGAINKWNNHAYAQAHIVKRNIRAYGLTSVLNVYRNSVSGAYIWPKFAQANTKIILTGIQKYGQAQAWMNLIIRPAQAIAQIINTDDGYRRAVLADLPMVYYPLDDEAPAGTNLVRFPVGGSASYTGYNQYSASYAYAKAADGIRSDGWAASGYASEPPEVRRWWQVDWTVPQTIKTVRLINRPSYTFGYGRIIFSDGTYYSVTFPNSGNESQLYFVDVTNVTSMRIISDGGGNSNPGFSEVEAYIDIEVDTLHSIVGRRNASWWYSTVPPSFSQTPAILSGTSIYFGNNKALDAGQNMWSADATTTLPLAIPGQHGQENNNNVISPTWWGKAGDVVTIHITTPPTSADIGIYQVGGENQWWSKNGYQTTGGLVGTAGRDVPFTLTSTGPHFVYLWTYNAGYTGTGTVTITGSPIAPESTIPMAAGSAITVETWVKWDGTTDYRMILGFDNYNFSIFAGKLGFEVPTNQYWSTASAVLIAGVWYHVAAVMYTEQPVGTANKIYVNGVLQSLSGQNPTGYFQEYFNIGGWSANNGYNVYSTLDEYAVFNYELTAEQILVHYNTIPIRYAQAQAQLLAFDYPQYAQSQARIADNSRYGSAVEADTPVTFYRLRETSGSIAHDQTSTDTGNYGGTQTLNQTSPIGPPNNPDAKAIYVNGGGSSYVSINQLTSTFTLELWAKSDNNTIELDAESITVTSGTSGERYIWSANNMGGDSGLGVALGTNGISVYEHGSGYMPAVSVYPVALGTAWHHIVITVSNHISRTYIDGLFVHQGLQSTRGTLYSSSQIGVGDYGNFVGYIAEPAIYNYVLSDARILAHFWAGINGQVYGQAQARIIGFGYPVYAQALAMIKGLEFAQAQAHIFGSYPRYGQALGLITRDGEGLVRMIWTGEYTPYPENIIAWGIEDQSGQIYYDNNGTPVPDYPGTNAGAAWTTRFTADATGTWSFRTVSDDNSEVTIDSVVIVANYSDQFTTVGTGHGDWDRFGPVELTLGQEYNLHVRWTQGGGPYTIHVYYKRPADSTWNLLLDNKPPWLPVSKIRVWAQAQAQILRPPNIRDYAQAQARILAYKVKGYGQAQSRLLAFNQNVWGQALAFVGHFQSGNAQARILAFNINKYGQSQANILKSAGYGQAQAKLNAFNVNRYAIAHAKLRAFNVNGFGQARVTVLRSASGLTQARIKQTYPLFYLNNYALSSLGATATALPAELTIPNPNDSNFGGPINTIDGNSLSLWESLVNVAPENDDERVKLIIDLGQHRVITGYYILPDKYNSTVSLQWHGSPGNTIPVTQWVTIVPNIYLPVNISTPLSGDNAVRGFIAPSNQRWWRLIVTNGGDGNRISLATFGLGVGLIQSGTFAQAMAMFGHYAVAQAAYYISPAFDQNVYGQAQADIVQTYQIYGQSEAWLIPPTQWSQALAQIIQTYALDSNAMAWIIPPTQWSQALATIKAYDIEAYGFAKAHLIGHYARFGNARTYVSKTQGYAHVAVSVFKRGNIARGGAIAYIGHFQFAQAGAFILWLAAYSNAQAQIKTDYIKSAQAIAVIQRFDKWGLAKVHILQDYRVYSQSIVLLNRTWGIGLANSQIHRTYYRCASTRTWIKDIYRGYAQTEAWITLRNLKIYSQARTFVVKTTIRGAQAQVQIGGFQYSQAQARILAYNVPKVAQSAGYILANINIVPPIPTSGMARYLVQYNGHLVPGYAQSESYDSIANTASHYTAYFDSSLSEYIGLENKIISLTMKVWEPTYLECKLKVQEAATILRSVRKQFARLYIQRTDRYYLAMPKSLKMAKDVSSSGKFIDYDMEFEAKPWIIEDRINTISGTGIIDTGARFGGWTPTTILVTGTDITISGLTEQGQDTGTISISGYVENFVVDTEDFTSGNNAVITPKNYGIYVGPGKTYFTISGATSCIITYQNRWYL